MAYNDKLADRVRRVLDGRRVTEKKMFGGLTFLVNGNMFVGIVQDTLMVRVGPDAYEAALTKLHAREMDFTGKPLRGYVYVDPAGLKGRALKAWVERGWVFGSSLRKK